MWRPHSDLGGWGQAEPNDIVLPPSPSLLPVLGAYCSCSEARCAEPGPTVLSVPFSRWPDVTPVSLLVILAKYGLDGRKDAQAVNSNYLSDTAEDDSLGDPKLEKLWHKVPLGAPREPQSVLPGVES